MKPALIVKKLLAPVLYRHRPIGLSAGKLYRYLDALYVTNDLPGPVLEIGCNICGTSTLGYQMLQKLASKREYYCIDTFGGFVADQFQKDMSIGTPATKQSAFSNNDVSLARKVLQLHKSENVKLIQADIVKVSEDQLPDNISVCLLDVDLYEPILAGLEKVYPRLSKGGIILIDDCGGDTWKAGLAFKEFVEKNQVTEWKLEFGMGIIKK